MLEVWEIINDYPNYAVSNLGNVKNIKTGKLLKQKNNGKGYLNVDLYSNSKSQRFYVHRLVALAFIKNEKNFKEINHIDGNKQNNIFNNLEWCSRSANNKHAWTKSLRKITEKHSIAARKNIKSITPQKLELGREKSIQTNSNKSKKEYYINSRNQFISLYCIELHKVFLSASRVEEKLGIKQNTILCNIKRGHKTCGGYHWKVLPKRY